jgi:hypothetical protein
MPVKSPYPDFEIPDLDIWSFLFERKDRDFPEDKSKLKTLASKGIQKSNI